MTCPYLEYRSEGDGQSFEEDRPFCGAIQAFVQPMRADVCNDRYELDHATDCEIYLAETERSEGSERADEAEEGG